MVAVGVILNLILLDFEYGSAGVNVTDGVKFVDLEEIFCKEIFQNSNAGLKTTENPIIRSINK